MRSFDRIAVLNRGEAAVRFIRALREYNIERGTSLAAVAFFTDPDQGTPFTRMADESVHLGPALRRPSSGGTEADRRGPCSAYCDHEHVLSHLLAARCDAVWPGWGFVAEDAAFAEKVEEAGIVFLGPSSKAMRLLGDKITSRKIAAKADVPVAPWFVAPDDATQDGISAQAESVGYPLMVKASSGGGGRGIRRVDHPNELVPALKAVRQEALASFGEGGVLIEKCVTGAHHIEVQLACGADGKAKALGTRDCSIQRRHQKVLEESPSPVLPFETARELESAAARMAEIAGYEGVGTAEFLYDSTTRSAWFLEVNSRLQVEHTVTEAVTGIDLVKAQIDIARGLPWLENAVPETRGHAIEVRLNAENPERDFAPSPGFVRLFRPPSGPGVRVDTGLAEGMTIAPEFDSMIAKIIAWGSNRRQAIARLTRALREMAVVIEDGATNKAFLLELLANPTFLEARADTGWLDRASADGLFSEPARQMEALLAAAIVTWRDRRRIALQQFFAEVQNGIPTRLPSPEGLEIDLRIRGRVHDIRVHAIGPNRYLAGPDDLLKDVTLEPTGPHSAVLHISGRRHQVLYSRGRTGISVEVDGVHQNVEHATGGVIAAPAPATVVHLAVSEGDAVEAGTLLLTLEAMKMEMPVFAREAGLVRSVLCQPNQQVRAGQPMVILDDTLDSSRKADKTSGSTEKHPPGLAPTKCSSLFAEGRPSPAILDRLKPVEAAEVIDDLIFILKGAFLGYEVPAAIVDRIDALLGNEQAFRSLSHPERWTRLVELLACFADVESLFNRNLLPLKGRSSAVSAELAFYEFCRRHQEGESGCPEAVMELLRPALEAYDVRSLDPSDALREALWRIAVAHAHCAPRHRLASAILRVVVTLHESGTTFEDPGLADVLEKVAQVAHHSHPSVADNARQAAYVLFEQFRWVQRRKEVKLGLHELLEKWRTGRCSTGEDETLVQALAGSHHPLLPHILEQADPGKPEAPLLLRAMVQRLHAGRDIRLLTESRPNESVTTARFDREGRMLLAVLGDSTSLERLLALITAETSLDIAELVLFGNCDEPAIRHAIDAAAPALLEKGLARLTVSWANGTDSLHHRTWVHFGDSLTADPNCFDIHPETARRLEIWRLSEFELERIEAPEQIVAFRAHARSNPEDERIFVTAEVGDVPDDLGEAGKDESLWEFERAWFEALRVIRQEQSRRDPRRRLRWNRITFHVRPLMRLDVQGIVRAARRLEAHARGLGLEKVVVCARTLSSESGETSDTVFVVERPGRHRMEVRTETPSKVPIRALSPYELRVVRASRMGCVYPYELARMLEGHSSSRGAVPHLDMVRGRFMELDLDPDGRALIPADRPLGESTCGVVVGLVTNYTSKHPEGLERVWIASDPTCSMGALFEPKCRRIIAAIDLAEARGLPVEWLPISSGAKIAMDSGTENLDWTARVLHRIVRFTQAGGEINTIVAGVNVGAQSYWNAEATMLMHTRGILIMTPEGSMVLTGKKALEASGGVAAEDERGIGGFERIMGPNGQAAFSAGDLGHAYQILFEHYRFTWRQPGEVAPRLQATSDSEDRSILDSPYEAAFGEPFAKVGDIFDESKNPGRKRPFAIREVMATVMDQDDRPLERFSGMAEAETAVVWDAHIGGHPVCLVGFESRPIPRRGRLPLDGPDVWTGGTLFPKSSKKVARALNSASGNRPAVILANLTGFDGSPESMRRLQLEYGAEIGRAVVNFDGPIVFVVIGRYHGGAYVVFSKALNPDLTALAVEGSYASVIGGAPAAKVVFHHEVRRRAQSDQRVREARKALEQAAPNRRLRLREELDELLARVLIEKQGEVASAFDSIHTVERAVKVGSLDAVIPPSRVRPAIIQTIRRSLARGPTRRSGSTAFSELRSAPPLPAA